MMLPPRAVIPALLAAAFIMMLSGQLWMKVTKLSRTSRGLRDASGRISKTLAFVTSMCRYDLEVIRRCRRCMVRLASARIREVALFGAGDVARVLRLQALAAGVDVVA